MENEIKQFTPWAIIISALIISLALYWNASTINGGLTTLTASVEKIQVNAPASGTAAAQPTAKAQQPDLSFASDPKLYPSMGDNNAKVTVYEFSDFQCPFCAMISGLPPSIQGTPLSQIASNPQYGGLVGTAQKLQALAQKGSIKFVYVTLSFLGPESTNAAEAGLCANDQGKFYDMYTAIFTANDGKENNGKYNVTKLEDLGKGISGLDTAKFNSCLESKKYEATVPQMTATAFQASQIKGTPALFISYNGNNVFSEGIWSDVVNKLNAAGVQVS